MTVMRILLRLNKLNLDPSAELKRVDAKSVANQQHLSFLVF